jgi:chromosome segregation ATPase
MTSSLTTKQEALLADVAAMELEQVTSVERLTADITALTQEVNTLTAARSSLTAQLAEVSRGKAGSDEQCKALMAKIATLNGDAAAAQQRITVLQAEQAELQRAVKMLQDKLVAQQEETASTKAQAAKDMADLTAEEAGKRKEAQDRLCAEIAALKQQLHSKSSEAATAQTHIRELTQTMQDVTAQLNSVQLSEAKLLAEKAALDQANVGMVSEISDLRSKHGTQRAV